MAKLIKIEFEGIFCNTSEDGRCCQEGNKADKEVVGYNQNASCCYTYGNQRSSMEIARS